MVAPVMVQPGRGLTVTVPLALRWQLFEVITVTVYVVVTVGFLVMLGVVSPELHRYVTPEACAARLVTVAVRVTGLAVLQIVAEFTPTTGLGVTVTVPLAVA